MKISLIGNLVTMPLLKVYANHNVIKSNEAAESYKIY